MLKLAAPLLAVLSLSLGAVSPAAQGASHEPVMTIGELRFESWQAYTSSPEFQALGLRCGRERVSTGSSGPLPVMASDCAYTSTNPTATYAPTTLFDVPVVFHVLQRSDGTGFVSSSRIQDQIAILNEDFRALFGSPGSPGVDTMIQFHLATTDPSGSPTTGITYSTNDGWYNDSGTYYSSLAWDTNRYVNVYTNSAGGFLGYVPDLPQGGLVGSNSDRVVVLHSAVGRNAPIGAPYNQGRTLTHEVGHYLGLEHTFSGGCGGGNCYTSGDLICDTNPESSATFGCPGSSTSCSTSDPIHNYMDYTDDLCMWEFSEEQARRMRCTLEFWRPLLSSSSCAAASATPRFGGPNPFSLTMTAPVLGTTVVAQVDVSTSGHTMAELRASLTSANQTLSNGSVLLANVASLATTILRRTASGPVAVFNLQVPNDQSLCGLPVYFQAAHLGGLQTFVLSNAQDVVLGN